MIDYSHSVRPIRNPWCYWHRAAIAANNPPCWMWGTLIWFNNPVSHVVVLNPHQWQEDEAKAEEDADLALEAADAMSNLPLV